MTWRHVEIVRTLMKIREDIRELKALVIGFSQNRTGPLNTVFISTGIQKTVNALTTFTGPASAEQIAKITGRSRAVESSHLNELYRTGMATKGKRGRNKVFTLKEEYYAKG